jgi:hypothetical protein
MFDHLRYEDKLPNNFNGKDCQTKSFECDLHQYIVRNGHLFRLTLANDITKEVEFYGFDESKDDEFKDDVKIWNTYKIKVVEGKIQDVKLTEKAIYEYENYVYKKGHIFYVIPIEELKKKIYSEPVRVANLSVSSPVETDNKYNYALIREIEVGLPGLYEELPRVYYISYEEALQAGQTWLEDNPVLLKQEKPSA